MTQLRLSYAYGTSEQPLLGMTIGNKFDQACQQYADPRQYRGQQIPLNF